MGRVRQTLFLCSLLSFCDDFLLFCVFSFLCQGLEVLGREKNPCFFSGFVFFQTCKGWRVRVLEIPPPSTKEKLMFSELMRHGVVHYQGHFPPNTCLTIDHACGNFMLCSVVVSGSKAEKPTRMQILGGVAINTVGTKNITYRRLFFGELICVM